MIVTLELRASARCLKCSVLTPLPGLRNRMSCRNCASIMDLEKRALEGRDGGLRYQFGGYYDALAEAVIVLAPGPEPQDLHDARDSHGTPVELRRAAPTCQACEAALTLPGAGATTVRCPQCADEIPVRQPDDETRTWDDRIAYVIGDGKDRGQAPKEQSALGSLVGCGRCGAPIAAADPSDRRRSRACTHCGASNYIPDVAWLGLFPDPEWHRCYLVYEIDARRLLALHAWLARNDRYWLEDAQEARVASDHATARAAARGAIVTALAAGDATASEVASLASDASLDDREAAAVDARLDDETRELLGASAGRRLVTRWAASPSLAVRLLVAAHPTTGTATLDGLAGDVDESVRAAVAARPETSPEVLARLRKDASDSVTAAVRKNPSYKPGFFERLFG